MRGDVEEQNPTKEPTALEPRVEELEVRSAFIERSHEDLDDVVREFTQRVETLERELREVRAQLERLRGASSDGG